MVTPEELRIGNWVTTPRGAEQVIDVMCDCVNTASGTWRYEDIRPKMILMKTADIFDLGNDFKLGYDGDDFVKGNYTWNFKRLITGKIKYVHQLQNLYFALTGKELSIEL